MIHAEDAFLYENDATTCQKQDVHRFAPAEQMNPVPVPSDADVRRHFVTIPAVQILLLANAPLLFIEIFHSF